MLSWLEAESAVKREGLAGLSGLSSVSLSSTGGDDTPSFETTRLKLAEAVWVLLVVAYIRGVPTGQYMA